MKIRIFLLLPAVLMYSFLCASTPDYRYGKVSKEELQMTVYDKDPEASAVFLYEDNLHYYYLDRNISRITEYYARIKVLKPEGADYANVYLAYISEPDMKEQVQSFDAVAYNLEDGKIVKTPLKKQYAFTEQIDEQHTVLKFSIPEVRAGTVIEYRYRLASPNIAIFPSFVFQHDIPVVCSHMEIVIPEFFDVKVNLKGYLNIGISEEKTASTIAGPDGSFGYNFTNRVIKTSAQDIPALKSEPYVWCLNDFRSMLEFELSRFAFPRSIAQNFSGSWENVNKTLESSPFYNACRIGNPFKDEVAAIKAQNLTPAEKARAILKLVQSRIKWDGKYRLISERSRAAANAGSGSSAEINFVLMAALKDGGFDVVPILLNPRHIGRLPYTHATLENIGMFILRIELDGEYCYVDGTDPNSDLNVLPTELLVDRARVYGVNDHSGWCNLSHLTQDYQSLNMLLTLNEDGTITGQASEDYQNQAAFDVSTRYYEALSEQAFIEEIEKENNIRIENVHISGIGSAAVRITYDMAFTPNLSDQYVYLNATGISFMSKNQFNTESRVLPIEFTNTRTYNIRCTLLLPNEYAVEERPEDMSIAACDEGVKCRYVSQVLGSSIQLNFTFATSRLVFVPTEYQALNVFFGMIVDQNNSQFVIRRNSEK